MKKISWKFEGLVVLLDATKIRYVLPYLFMYKKTGAAVLV